MSLAPRSVRARITMVATAVVAVAVAAGGVAFVLILSISLFDSAATAAESEAERFETLIDEGGATALAGMDGYAQLLSGGRVVAATDDLDDAGPLVTAESDDAVTVTVPGDDDRLVVVATEVDDFVLVAGVSDDGRDEAVATTRSLLLVAGPIVVAVVGLTCWIVVGRALRPVERMRRAAELVTAADLGRRVDVPGSGDEVERLALTMNGMLERLEQSQRRQRRFVSDASHELRSPVSSLRQNAEIAVTYPNRTDLASFGATVAGEADRMAGIIDGLLLLARADEATLRPVERPVDLDDLALNEVRRLRDAGGIVVDGSSITAVRVLGDAVMLSRALRNLVDNARRHASSRVAIASATDTAGRALLIVDDDGAGVPEAERGRVFERFVRLDESRARDSGGSGLGLSIVYEIATAHGGSVAVGDSPLGGARFVISLPRLADD